MHNENYIFKISEICRFFLYQYDSLYQGPNISFSLNIKLINYCHFTKLLTPHLLTYFLKCKIFVIILQQTKLIIYLKKKEKLIDHSVTHVWVASHKLATISGYIGKCLISLIIVFFQQNNLTCNIVSIINLKPTPRWFEINLFRCIIRYIIYYISLFIINYLSIH